MSSRIQQFVCRKLLLAKLVDDANVLYTHMRELRQLIILFEVITHTNNHLPLSVLREICVLLIKLLKCITVLTLKFSQYGTHIPQNSRWLLHPITLTYNEIRLFVNLLIGLFHVVDCRRTDSADRPVNVIPLLAEESTLTWLTI